MKAIISIFFVYLFFSSICLGGSPNTPIKDTVRAKLVLWERTTTSGVDVVARTYLYSIGDNKKRYDLSHKNLMKHIGYHNKSKRRLEALEEKEEELRKFLAPEKRKLKTNLVIAFILIFAFILFPISIYLLIRSMRRGKRLAEKEKAARAGFRDNFFKIVNDYNKTFDKKEDEE